jgi:hypothetical protein
MSFQHSYQRDDSEPIRAGHNPKTEQVLQVILGLGFKGSEVRNLDFARFS